MPSKSVGAEVLEELEGLFFRSKLKEVLDLILDCNIEDCDTLDAIIYIEISGPVPNAKHKAIVVCNHNLRMLTKSHHSSAASSRTCFRC